MSKVTGKILPEALKSLFQKPATISWPRHKEDALSDIRGKLIFDSAKCVGCKLCVKDCPTGAIDIQKTGEKQFKAILQKDHCVFCGQCADSCNKDALICGPDFELAELSRKEMETDI